MTKIAEASKMLVTLNAQLAIQKKEVQAKTEDCEKLLEEISSSTEEANRKKAMAQVKGKEIEESSKIIAVEKVIDRDVYYMIL